MRCRSALTRIDALRTDELRSEEHGELKEHLRTCRSCDESVNDVRSLADMVKSLAVAPPRSCRDAVCRETADRYDRVESGNRAVWVAFTDHGIRMITTGSLDDLRAQYGKRYGRALENAALPASLKRDVVSALAGEGVVGKPHIDLAEASELESAVMQTLSSIPRGEVRTYSWLAQQIGRPRAVRAVANFVARNNVPFVVPCHRVVPLEGGVGKYAFGSRMKRDLLEREGVDVDALDALARRGIRFIGSKSTRIFCFPTCRDAQRIREDNRVPFHAVGEAEKKGFRACKRCRPAAA